MSRPLLAFLLLALALGGALAQEPRNYRSPYEVKFTQPLAELVGDLEREDRGEPRRQSSLAFAEWSSEATKQRHGPWGPPARKYSPPAKLAERSAEWRRERVIAVGLRYRGYGYQHHHIPDWDPPAGWPWKETAMGQNGKGLDCSNFSSFAYNQALGVKFTSDVKKQAELTEVDDPLGGGKRKLLRVEKPERHDDFVKALKMGDLVFIRNKRGEIGHVVLWVGAAGAGSDGLPLVLDSTSESSRDSAGLKIPPGIQLRPFRPTVWYWTLASHALRVIE